MQGSIKLNTSSLEASRATLDVQRKVRPVEDWAMLVCDEGHLSSPPTPRVGMAESHAPQAELCPP